MSYSTADVQRIHNLLGQALWYTQHFEMVMNQYNALMLRKIRYECGEHINDDDIKNALTTSKKRNLESLISEAKEQGFLPKRLEIQAQLFLKTRGWILHECVNDIHLSFKKENSKKFFFGIIESYVKDAKALKAEMFQEMETWLKQNGYDLDQVYPRP